MLRPRHQFLTAMLHVPSVCCVWVCRNTCNEMIISKETRKVLKPIMATPWTAESLKCYMMKLHFAIHHFSICQADDILSELLNKSMCVNLHFNFLVWSYTNEHFEHNNPTDMEKVTLSSNCWNCLKNEVDTVILQFRAHFPHLKAWLYKWYYLNILCFVFSE